MYSVISVSQIPDLKFKLKVCLNLKSKISFLYYIFFFHTFATFLTFNLTLNSADNFSSVFLCMRNVCPISTPSPVKLNAEESREA